MVLWATILAPDVNTQEPFDLFKHEPADPCRWSKLHHVWQHTLKRE